MSLGYDFDLLYERRLRETHPSKILEKSINTPDPHGNAKTYAMDFDGVLHYHEPGSGPGPLGKLLGPGVKMAKRIKAAGHNLVVFTARPEEQHHEIEGLLKGNGVKVDQVTNKKPVAEYYIDDRALAWPRNWDDQETEEVIHKTGSGYQVKSEKGKNLSSKNLSKAAAKKRLAQVEYFKHKKEAINRFGENGGDGSQNFLDGDHYVSLATHESNRLREYGTQGMKWGVRKERRHAGAKLGLPPQEYGFKAKMAMEMFGKKYKDLERPDKNKVKQALKNRGMIRPMNSGEASDDEKALRDGKVVSVQSLGGGINNTKLVTMEDGSKAVFKVENTNIKDPLGGKISRVRSNISMGKDAEREVAAWQVAKIAGLQDIVAPCIIREVNGQRGSLMKFWDGDLAFNMDRGDRYDGQEDRCRAAMFDYVIGNEDRHQGNWLVGHGKMQLIDHGLSFPEDEFYYVHGQGNCRILGEVGASDKQALSVKEAGKPFVENKEKILSALKDSGLPKSAIDGVSSRIDRISRKDSWEKLARL